MKVNYRQYRHRSRGYITSLSVTGAMVAAGILGSVTGVVDAASHQGRFTQPTVIQRLKNATQNSTTQQPAAQTPAATTPTTPATTQPAATTTAPVVTSQPIVVKPPDTAAGSQTTTAAQANTDSIAKPVSYTTNQISDELRDRLMIMAAIVGASGLALYAITFMKPKAPTPRSIPIHYAIPVEVAAR